jgi:hypothetical protein
MYIEGDVPYVTGNGYNNNNSGWNDWSWIIGLAVVGGIFGNGGFGFGGGNNRGNCATTAELSAGFANSEIMSDLNDILIGQANAINYNNQGFAGLNQTITNGFSNLNTALCGFNYNVQGSFNSLSHQLAECCCTTQRAIDSVKYENAKNTCDIIRAGQDNTRAILDFLTSEKISSLQAENSGLKAQISNDRQTRTIIDEIKPCPIPAYITCNPYQSAYGFGNNFGNNGCGCC